MSHGTQLRWHQRLLPRFALAIILTEIIVLSTTGYFYILNFSRQIDQTRDQRMNLPVEMMANGQLSYDAVENEDLLMQLVDDEVEEAVVFGTDGTVFHSLREGHEGKPVWDFTDLTPDTMADLPDGALINMSEGPEHFTIIHRPLKVAGGRATFAHLYLKVLTTETEKEKARITRLFIVGSVLVVGATTLLIVYLFEKQVNRAVELLLHFESEIRAGDTLARIDENSIGHEFKLLAGRFNLMLESLNAREKEIFELSRLRSAIVDNAAYSIISGNPEGIITSFNKAAERMLGYSAEEMIGKQTPAIIHLESEVEERARDFSEELGIEVRPGFETLIIKSRFGLKNEHEWTYVRKDGSTFPVTLNVTALWDESGKITGYLGIAGDITEKT